MESTDVDTPQPGAVRLATHPSAGASRSPSVRDAMIETVVPAPPLPSTQDPHWLDRAAGQAFVSASLYNGLGRYEDALAAAERAADREEESLLALALPELIEAAARSGRPRRADEAIERLAGVTRALGHDWA